MLEIERDKLQQYVHIHYDRKKQTIFYALCSGGATFLKPAGLLSISPVYVATLPCSLQTIASCLNLWI
jgi:hypothetical protein